ncbi:AI-2E family transporter [Rhizobium sp. S-51]|uniref:AI-2E family transporter n=2 Tax=Rhizobium terricola TaxID=2728849 RepID=A0A7Y0FXS3_9HYPH|nr:AI-2E family transporter [Rhizobium terricola]
MSMGDRTNGSGRGREARARAAVETVPGPFKGPTSRRTYHRVRVRKTALDLALIWSVIGIFAIMAVAAVYLAASVLMPITFAIVIGLILGVAADRLGALGIPPMLTALILSTLFAMLLFFTANTLIGPLTELAGLAPAMVEAVIERILPYLEKIEWLHISRFSFTSGPVTPEALIENTGTVLTTFATHVTPAVVQGLIFFAALLLFLGSRLTIRKTLIIAFRDRARRLAAIRTINSIEQALGFYFATASLLYAVVGVAMVLISWIGGLSMPVLWGFFAFLSSFIPFLGVTAMTLALAIGGLVTHDSLFMALSPALAFFIVHMVMENLVTPAVMGRRLEINPFAVFVAIIFWTWMWGAVGAVLAVPLSLIALTIANELLPSQKIQPNLPG